MIKFFRKIRQNLIMENKTSKYFKYAIGEIVLVVIGILIALQINNWNQNRLDRNFENVMLKEVKNSLESDMEIYDIFVQRASAKKDGIQELLQLIDSKKSYPDSVLLRAYNKMTIGFIFNYNKGGYEAIKSVGLDKISNDSLRTKLIATYEMDLPRLELFFKSIEKDVTNQEYKLNLHNALWKRIQIQMPDNSLKLVSRPINSEEFINEPDLIDRIKIEQDNLSSLTIRLPYFKNIIENTLLFVNQELNE